MTSCFFAFFATRGRPAAALAVGLLVACAGRPTGGVQPATERAAPPSATDTADIVVAATTDVHGWLWGWDYYAGTADSVRGLARAASVVDSVRRANPGRVLLVDAGDLLQGNPLAYVAARVSSDSSHPVIAAMNAMRYDAAAIGNHEYNYGVDLLDRAARQARFPFLSANTYRPGGERAYAGWRIVERAGVRVGIVGATTPGVMVWDRDNVRGRVELRDVVPAVRAAVGEARGAGADIVVVVAHSGLGEPSSYDSATTGVPAENVSARLARDLPGIDLVVFGHSHKEVADTVIGSTLLVQPKNWAASVAVAHLGVVRDAGRWRVASRRGSLVPAAGHPESPAVLAATERAHRATVDYVGTAVGHTPVAWRADSGRVADTPLIDFVLEVERRAAGSDLASTAAFSLEASLDSGAITVAELARLYPYDNTLRAIRISGRQLREYLEHTARYYRTYLPRDTVQPLVDPAVPGYNFDVLAGAEYVLDLTKPVGRRVTHLAVKGRAVAPSDSFTLALNNYRQTGGGGYSMLAGAPVVYDEQREIRQLLIDEVKRRGTILPADYASRNWRLEPTAAIGAAYAASNAGGSTGPGRRSAAAGGAPPPGRSPEVPRSPPPERLRDARIRASAPATPGARPTRRVHLRIIATNDFHGALEPRPDSRGVLRGGAAALAASIRRAAAECAPACATLVVDGGDMFQGTPASNLAYGRPVAELFDTLGYAAAALGNHEFDWGVDTLKARMRQARYAILGANVRYADGRDVEWIRDDTIVTRGPLRIGIVGIAGVQTAWTTRARNVAGLRFDDPAPVVDAHARSLRSRGADVVVVVAHTGGFCGGDRPDVGDAPDSAATCTGDIVDLARRLTEPVDAIVSGHTHSLIDAAVRGTPVVQARSGGRAVAVIDLDVDSAAPGATRGRPRAAGGAALTPSESARARRWGAQVRDVFGDSAAGAEDVVTLVRRARQAVAGVVERPVATVAEDMRRTGEQYALGNLIADAQRAAGRGDVAIMNNGGIRADLPAGPANYGTLFEVQPFGNTLYRVTVTGRDLREYLEGLLGAGEPRVHVSGLTVAYDPRRPAGSRIAAVQVGGAPLRDGATYAVVMNDFMAMGGDALSMGRRARRTEPLDVVDLDALISYMQAQRGPVRPPAGDRFIQVRR